MFIKCNIHLKFKSSFPSKIGIEISQKIGEHFSTLQSSHFTIYVIGNACRNVFSPIGGFVFQKVIVINSKNEMNSKITFLRNTVVQTFRKLIINLRVYE